MSNAKAPKLSDLQRWMMDAITHPDGIRAGIDSSRNSPPAIKGQKAHAIVRRSKNLTSLERINIYHEMYYLRLIDILRGDFPAVLYALGDDVFTEMAREYIIAHPSQHYDLNGLGAKFPGFMRGVKRLKHRIFLGDLAKLERAIEEVFDEQPAKALTVDELLRVPQDQWVNARLQPVPALRLVASRFPINDFLEAVRGEKDPLLPAAKASHLVVYRKKNLRVWRLDLDAPQFAMLNALVRGKTVGQAVELCMEAPDAQSIDLAASVKRWFDEWAAFGFFSAVKL